MDGNTAAGITETMGNTVITEAMAHSVASSSNTIELIAGIGIPVLIFIIVPLVIFTIRGIIKGAQWFAHQQEAADSTARSNESIATDLHQYITKSDDHFRVLDQDVAILKDWRARGSRRSQSENESWGDGQKE
jgi:hypothetical protein